MAPSHTELRALVDAFYRRVRQDERLGPIFETHVEDWEAHSARLTDFWSSLMLASGRYKGNPFAAHLPFATKLDPSLFDRWLALWHEATHEAFAPEIAAAFETKARRVAESLKAGLFRPSAMITPETASS